MKSKRIRICYVIGSLALGGAETQLIKLVNGLDRERFDPSIVCLVDGGDLEGALARDVTVTKPRRPATRTRNSRGNIDLGRRALATLAAELYRRRPHVLHAYLPAAYVPASIAGWSMRVPVIVCGRRGFTSTGMYRSLWWRTLAGLANRIIDVQICNSSAVRDAAVFEEHVPPQRTRVISNGVDLPGLDDYVLPLEFVWAGDQAAMVANFIAYKGHAQVLQATAMVVQRHPGFRLVLIGDGPERANLEHLVIDLQLKDHVVLAGRRRDAANLINGFAFSILGSSEESMPNAIMESMAAGVPVVSTRVGGVTELMDDGIHGLLVPFGDIDKMAEAICWMLEHPEERRRMGGAGRDRVAAQFSTGRMVTRTEAVYEEFVALRSGSAKSS